jgi:hypothetical protein
MLAAWLIVDTLMRTVLKGGNLDAVYSGYGPWSSVQCAEQVSAGVKAGFFEGDADWVPGEKMSTWNGATYSGGPLPQCSAAQPACTVSALMAAGFNQQQANIMSCIALTESGGNPLNPPYIIAHPTSNSTACGLFAVTRQTWSSTATGDCKDFSKCTDARCNTQVTLKLVKTLKYSPWTCPGCNNKAQACVNQYSNSAAAAGISSKTFVGAWGTNDTPSISATTKLNTKKIIDHAFTHGATSFVVAPPNSKSFKVQHDAVVAGVQEIVKEKGYRASIKEVSYETSDPLHMTLSEAQNLSRLGSVYVGDSNALRVYVKATGSTQGAPYAYGGKGTSYITNIFVQGFH